MIGQLLSRRTPPRNSSIRLIAALGILSVGASLNVPTSTNASADRLSAKFTICSDRRRVNCIADGHTFSFRRQKIRMADVDAPNSVRHDAPTICGGERQRSSTCWRS